MHEAQIEQSNAADEQAMLAASEREPGDGTVEAAAPSVQDSLPPDPEALLEVRHLKKYFPANKDFFGRPRAFVKAVDDFRVRIKSVTTLGIVG